MSASVSIHHTTYVSAVRSKEITSAGHTGASTGASTSASTSASTNAITSASTSGARLEATDDSVYFTHSGGMRRGLRRGSRFDQNESQSRYAGENQEYFSNQEYLSHEGDGDEDDEEEEGEEEEEDELVEDAKGSAGSGLGRADGKGMALAPGILPVLTQY